MKRNRSNLSTNFIKMRSLPVKLIIVTLIIFLALSFIIGYIWKFLMTSDYFKIKDIIIKETDRADLSYLKGKNIFSVDLRNESRDILEVYPNYSKIKLIRVLPNRIFVDFVKRTPVAFVKLYRYFALDQDGVLFYAQDQPEELELPVIFGLETKIFGPKSGKSYNIKELAFALNIIKETKRNRILKNYKIKRINVASLANASIFILFPEKSLGYSKAQPIVVPEGVEIRLGDDNIKDKISILAGLIIQGKSELANMKYIDLRFKEPVIKLKDAK